MNVLTGIHNFLNFINENWTMIASIIVVTIAIVKKAASFFGLPKEVQLKIAKVQISHIMLRLVTEAECDYREWVKAGAIKRAQVIDEVFTMYPILSQIANQEEIISWIDEEIDKALKEMRKVFEENLTESQNPELAS